MIEIEIFGQTIYFVWDFIDYGMSPLAYLEAFFEFLKNLLGGAL